MSATVSAIAHQVGRLVLISSLIGSGFSLYSLLPVMAQTTTAQTVDEAEGDADPASAAESSSSESVSESADDATTEASEASESSDSAPATERRSPLSTARPNLRVGNEGQAVAELQALLKLLGYYEGAVDGRYSEATASAVSEFQAAAGLASDGVVGPATWGQLLPAAPVASPTSSANQTPSAAAVTVTDFPTPVLSPGELASGTSGTAATATETDDATAAPPADSAAAPGATSTPTTADDTSATAEPPATDAAADAAIETEPPATASLPADGSNPASYPILRLGASGPAVERLQERLRSLGHYQGAVDGVFGERTQEAVRAAQQRNQLTVDGVVGPATWDALLD